MSPRNRVRSNAEDDFAVLSIGALSRATGVPVETLRTWERRYDFPKPAPRGDTGHRRYPLEAVERLRLVVRALEAQHAPSVVLRATPDTLRDLVAVASDAPGRRAPLPAALPSEASESFEDRCTRYVLTLDGEALVAEFERSWDDVGGLDCLVECIGPFLTALGTGWSHGEVEVGHEHFASEHVREFLSGHWRPMSDRNEGARVVCATLAGELHVLGLHMAATALALAGARVIFLGANTPPEDIARVTKRRRARAIALSAALGTSARLLHEAVRTLQSAVPPEVTIVVGGAGFQNAPAGVLPKGDLRELSVWAKRLVLPKGAAPRRPVLK